MRGCPYIGQGSGCWVAQAIMPRGGSWSPLALGQEWPLRLPFGLAFGLAVGQSQVGLQIGTGLSQGGTPFWTRAGASSPLESQVGLGLRSDWYRMSLSQHCSRLLGSFPPSTMTLRGCVNSFRGCSGLVSIPFGVTSWLGLSRGTTETLDV